MRLKYFNPLRIYDSFSSNKKFLVKFVFTYMELELYIPSEFSN